MGTAPADKGAQRPTPAQIAATGRALPRGAHQLSGDQQRAWFGGVVFAGPVRWDRDAFVAAGERFTPDQVAAAARSGDVLPAADQAPR